MTQNKKTSRREFIATTGMATAGLTLGVPGVKASMYNRASGSNDKIRVGIIGLGRGGGLMNRFMTQPDCEIAALCDVDSDRLKRNVEGHNPERYSDYREMLDDKSIHAVVVATPDHWHCLQTIHAIQAGKDVFVEKPLTITIREGRMMIDAEKNSNQIAAVGLNRRGNFTYQKLAREVPAGRIGKITFARASRVNNMYPNGIGKFGPEKPPENLNWDAWLGPRAYRPYQQNIAPYRFRWWSDYSSQMGNWGVHHMDVIRWMMNEQAPIAISAHGGNFAVDDDRTIPDTMHVTYEFASGAIMTYSILEASSSRYFHSGEVELRGTKAALFASQGGYRIRPTSSGQFQTWEQLTDEEDFTLGDEHLIDGSSDGTVNLIRNFLDCIKSRRKPLCTLEEGHRSTSLAHLANIALVTDQKLRWDPVNEVFTNSLEGNNLLHYEYRKPYTL